MVVGDPFLLNKRTRTDRLVRRSRLARVELRRGGDVADLITHERRERGPGINCGHDRIERVGRIGSDRGDVPHGDADEGVGLHGVERLGHSRTINRGAIGEGDTGTHCDGPGLIVGTRGERLSQIRLNLAGCVVGGQRIEHGVADHVARHRPTIIRRVETVGLGLKTELDASTRLRIARRLDGDVSDLLGGLVG